MKAHGFKRVGLLAESNADTQNETGLIAQYLKGDGIRSDTETFPATAVSVTPEFAALKSDGDDALFAAAFGPAVGYAAKAHSDFDPSVPLIFDEDAASSDITKVASRPRSSRARWRRSTTSRTRRPACRAPRP